MDREATNNFVTNHDIQSLLSAQCTKSRGQITWDEYGHYIIDDSNDTLIFIYDKPEGGWTAYSSDTRTPAIIAQSNTGTYEESIKIDGVRLWMESMAQDIKNIRTVKDTELNISQKEIKSNQDFWLSIQNPNEYVKRRLPQQKKPISPYDYGHYELSSSVYQRSEYENVPHMVTVHWSQKHPYNAACPWRNDTTGVRVPAGCVPIAGAQMLHFLHYKLGVPETAPSKAYCYGKLGDKDFNWDQTDYTSDIWDKMDNSLFNTSAAPLIANLGKLVKIKYGNQGSGADTKMLIKEAFPKYGIFGYYDIFSTETLVDNLYNGMPVIISAYSGSESSYSAGHAFIIDSYTKRYDTYKNTYIWVYDSYPENEDGSLILVPQLPDKVEYKTQSVGITSIKMNWGWGGYCDDIEFTLTGDWIAPDNSSTSLNWSERRIILYGFKAME